jgi:hypothetical protein
MDRLAAVLSALVFLSVSKERLTESVKSLFSSSTPGRSPGGRTRGQAEPGRENNRRQNWNSTGVSHGSQVFGAGSCGIGLSRSH